MNRKIAWDTGVLDEIELVYEKAEQDADTASYLEQLETAALDEVRSRCGLRYDAMSQQDREQIIAALGGIGLAALDSDIAAGTITVELAPEIPLVSACTMFSLINRLEKLDGSFNVLLPGKKTLVLRVPLGGRKGLFRWEMLILHLYPWLSITETASSAFAVTGSPVPEKPTPSVPEKPAPSVPEKSAPSVPEKSASKKGFLRSLFAKKK